MDVSYDPNSLSLTGYGRGTLTRDFDFFAVTDNAGKGALRIGGIEAGDHVIKKGASGSIARLYFKVGQEANPPEKLGLLNLKDDLNPKSPPDKPKADSKPKPDDKTQPKPHTGKPPVSVGSNSGINKSVSAGIVKGQGAVNSGGSSSPAGDRIKSDEPYEKTDSDSYSPPESYDPVKTSQQTNTVKPNKFVVSEETYYGTETLSAKAPDFSESQGKNKRAPPPKSAGQNTHSPIPTAIGQIDSILSAIEKTNLLLRKNTQAIEQSNAFLAKIESNTVQIKNSLDALKIIMIFLCFIMLLIFAALVVFIMRTRNPEQNARVQ